MTGSADTPGVPPTQVPRPDEDLAQVVISLSPGGFIGVTPDGYDAGGRIHKWLVGQIQLARMRVADDG